MQSMWWIIFLLILVAFAVFSIILMYHWLKFAMDKKATIITFIIYFFGSALLLFIIFSAILALST